jgi:hypothetical protein
VPSQRARQVLRFDPRAGLTTARAAGRIPVAGEPAFIAVGRSAVWVGGHDRTVQRIDPATGTVTASRPVAGALHAMAVDGVSLWTAGPGGDVVTPGTCPGYTSPFEPYHSALTARISRIDRAGHRTTLAGGLPSARDRGWTVVADFSRFLAANPTAAPPDDDFEPDGALYSMLWAGRKLVVLEANHGEIDKVDPASGRIRRVLDISATRPHNTPTALARRGRHLYVGNLGSFPVQRGASVIFRVTLDGRHQRVVATGLTAVLGLAFDRCGRLYALETTTVDPSAGRILRVRLG